MKIVADEKMITRGPSAPAASYLYQTSQGLFHEAATSRTEGRSLVVVVAKRVAYLVAGYFLLIVSPIEALGRGGGAFLYRLITLRFSGHSRSLAAYFIEALHLGKLALVTPVLLFLSIFSFNRFIRYVDHLETAPRRISEETGQELAKIGPQDSPPSPEPREPIREGEKRLAEGSLIGRSDESCCSGQIQREIAKSTTGSMVVAQSPLGLPERGVPPIPRAELVILPCFRGSGSTKSLLFALFGKSFAPENLRFGRVEQNGMVFVIFSVDEALLPPPGHFDPVLPTPRLLDQRKIEVIE